MLVVKRHELLGGRGSRELTKLTSDTPERTSSKGSSMGRRDLICSSLFMLVMGNGTRTPRDHGGAVDETT